MYSVLKSRIIAIILSCILIACHSPTLDETSNSQTFSESSPVIQVKESQPSKVPIQNVKRVVALTSLSADIIYRLDAKKLVGIPGNTLLKQDERFQNLPNVSEGRTPPSLEKIVVLKPDVVIGAEGFHDQTFKQLKELGIATFNTDIKSWDSLKENTKILAQMTNTDPTPLLQKYDDLIKDMPQSNSSVLVLVSSQPILSPSKYSWTGDFLEKIKVNNLTASLQGESWGQGYITLSEEKIVQENPEIIIVVDPAKQGAIAQLKSKSFWNKLKAVQDEKVYEFDYYGLVNPGSIDKIEETSDQLKKIWNS